MQTTGAGEKEVAKMNVKGLSNATLKELYDIMNKRRKSCANNPQEENEYETQSGDWQRMFNEIEGEMKLRHMS